MTNTSSQCYTNSYLLAGSDSSQEILQALEWHVSAARHSKRLSHLEEVARVALFLASNNSSFVVSLEIAVEIEGNPPTV